MGVLLQVDNLSTRVTDEDLIIRFGDFGIVESAMMNQASPASPGVLSACVEMANSEEAQAAIDWLHDTRFKGSTISVCRALNFRPRLFHFGRPH